MESVSTLQLVEVVLGQSGNSNRKESVVDLQCTAVFRKVPEGYIAFIEEFPGANTQGASLEEARANLREAVALVVEANRILAREDVGGIAVIRDRSPLGDGLQPVRLVLDPARGCRPTVPVVAVPTAPDRDTPPLPAP